MNIALILQSKFPNKIWTLDGEDYEGLTWLDDSPKPTKEELEDLVAIVEQEQETAKQISVAAKESAIAKLSALGLSKDEIKALVGA